MHVNDTGEDFPLELSAEMPAAPGQQRPQVQCAADPVNHISLPE
jgi:hypothetical protein